MTLGRREEALQAKAAIPAGRPPRGAAAPVPGRQAEPSSLTLPGYMFNLNILINFG